jgi:hypothetical protein
MADGNSNSIQHDDSGHIVGRPTLLVTFGERLDGQSVLSALGVVGYPVVDVRVYHRPEGTDQVIDAVTGKVPAGEALSRSDVSKDAHKLETLVLMHPNAEQFVTVRGALAQFGEADYKYSEATLFEGEG